MQRYASLDHTVMAFLTDATVAHVFGSVKDPLPSKSTMLPLSITPDTASKGLRTLAPWTVIRLEMSPPPCRSVRTFVVNSPALSIFSPPGPAYRCPSTDPFDGPKSMCGQSSGFTTDSPAAESTVISRYRPRSPSVATGLRSMDMLPIVTALKSTSSGSHSASLELSLGRSSHSLDMSYCGLDLILTMLCCAALLSARETCAFELNPGNRVNPRNLANPENPARSGELCLAMRASAGSMWNARRNIEACHFGRAHASKPIISGSRRAHTLRQSIISAKRTYRTASPWRWRPPSCARGRKSGARTHWH